MIQFFLYKNKILKNNMGFGLLLSGLIFVSLFSSIYGLKFALNRCAESQRLSLDIVEINDELPPKYEDIN